MGYIIGPDGKIVDDSQGMGSEPNAPISEEQMAEMVLGFAQQNPQPFTMPNVGAPTLDPYATIPSPPGVTSGDEAASGGLGGSTKEGVGVRVKTSGPNGKVPGNTDPYSFTPGKDGGVKKGLNAMGEAAQMGEASLDAQALSAEQTAAIDKKQLAEEEAYFTARQAKELEAADGLKARSERRVQMAQEAKQEAVDRVAKWEQEQEAAVNTEVDPDRYWNSRSGFQKTMFALGAAAGSLSEHVYGKNTAFDLLQKNILQDIGSQKDKIDRKIDFMKDKRSNIEFLNNLDRLEIDDLDQETLDFVKEYDVRLGAMDKEIDKIVKRYGQDRVSPTLLKTKADLLMARAKVRDGLGQAWYQEGSKVRDMQFQKEEAAKTRGHQRAMAREEREFELKMQKQKALDAATLQASKGVFNTSRHGGFIVTKGPNGDVKQGLVQVQEGMEKEFTEKLTNISTEFVALKHFQDIVSEDGADWKSVIKSTNRTAALEELVVSKVKARMGGQISDNDVNLIRSTITGAATGIGEWVKPGDATSVIEANLHRNRQEGNKIMTLYTVPTADGEATYDPSGLYDKQGGSEQPSNTDDVLAEMSQFSSNNYARKSDAKDPAVSAATGKYRDAIDVAFEQGDLEGLRRLQMAADEASGSDKEGSAPFKEKTVKRKGKLVPTTSPTSAVAEYAREKYKELETITKMQEVADQRAKDTSDRASGRSGTWERVRR